MHETTSHGAGMPRQPAARHALWALGFRPFYLLGALLSAAGMLLWILQFSPHAPGVPLAGGMPAMLWHAHEMVFGFTFAIIAGFLLTAVRAWTSRWASANDAATFSSTKVSDWREGSTAPPPNVFADPSAFAIAFWVASRNCSNAWRA